MNAACSAKVGHQFKGMLHLEAAFRKANHLPLYKDGDQFLNFLPQQAKEKYYDKKQEKINARKFGFHPPHGSQNSASPNGPPNSQ